MSGMEDHEVELPGGGSIHLQSHEECDRWNVLSERYQAEYALRKVNDLTNLCTLLVQQISLYRAQQAMSGRLPKLDEDGLPTGQFEMRVLKPAEIRAYQDQITNASKEIREIEKAMGIDKKSREQAGVETVRGYLEGLKARANEYGLHVSKRVIAYESFTGELRWRLRLEQNGDAEDKHYEHCTPEDILRWCREELDALELVDQKFAKEKGRLVVGTA